MPAANVLDIVPGSNFLSFYLNSLGQSFATNSGVNAQSTAAVTPTGRGRFSISQGYDLIGQTSTGTNIQGQADCGVALNVHGFALSLTATNLRVRTGLDDPLKQQYGTSSLVVGEDVPTLRVAAAKQYGEAKDSFLAASFDLKSRRPELSVGWSAATQTDKASVVLTADPVLRAVTVRAAVSTPGPEWRKIYFDEETQTLEPLRDDRERHAFWAAHTTQDSNLLASTRMGMRLSLHRVFNWIGDWIDYDLEEHIPMVVWRIPFVRMAYKLLVPDEDDDDQVRYRLYGWQLEATHDFSKRKPTLGISKALGNLGSVSATYDLEEQEAGLSVGGSALRVGARASRADGGKWSRPTLQLYVQPLSLLQ